MRSDGLTAPVVATIDREDRPMFLIHGGEAEHLLIMRFEQGDQGIPTFDTEEEAEMFLESTDAFGEHWSITEVPDTVMAAVLEEYADEVAYVVLNPPPEIPGERFDVNLVELEQYIEVLRT